MIDVFLRYIVGWRVLKPRQTALILDALAQVLWAQEGPKVLSIIAIEAVSIYPFATLIDSLVGSVGDSYDNAELMSAEIRVRV